MENNPLVSILVPVYNVQEYLTDCLDSILSQTYNNLQIVLIDDGSKDNSLKICIDYALRDSRIEVYHQENQGVASTRNNLLEKVKGDYVLFVDADDWIELDMVEYLLDLAIEHKADIVMCGLIKDNDNPTLGEIKILELNRTSSIRDFLRHQYFNGSLANKLIRASLVKGVNFKPYVSYGEDALFCWSILQSVTNVVVTNNMLYHYRMNDDSISHQLFGSKKLTGNYVWKEISDDVKILWPQFYCTAMTRYALENMWLLYFAARDGYPFTCEIKHLQNILRKGIIRILLTDLVSFNKKLFAVGMAISYKIMRFVGIGRK